MALSIAAVALWLTIWTSAVIPNNNVENINESINTIEDMKEFLLWDIEEGRIDKKKGNKIVRKLDRQLIKLYKKR